MIIDISPETTFQMVVPSKKFPGKFKKKDFVCLLAQKNFEKRCAISRQG